MKYLIIILLWTGYCALHSYLISIRFTGFLTRLLKSYYSFYRLFYIIISLVLLIPLINYSAQLADPVIITYVFPFSVIRYALMYGSLIMFFWAFFINYDSLSFFGIRQILGFLKIAKINPSEKIKKNGLLGLMRHPMYTSLIIYLWCQTFRFTDFIVNAVLTIYIIIGTRLEERKLVLEFGDNYIRYQQEVPMLIPFTKRKAKKHNH
jgi:protein-S-isoprenylcysteine O-methyltransferase Ste14